MQYKIPVQIENEDKIIGPLSLRQLGILIVGGGIGYLIFKGLAPSIGGEMAAIPGFIIFALFLFVVLFKHSEMTFTPFILNLIRLNINGGEKIWVSGVDSHQAIDIGYVTLESTKKDNKINLNSKKEKINNMQDKLNKL